MSFISLCTFLDPLVKEMNQEPEVKFQIETEDILFFIFFFLKYWYSSNLFLNAFPRI